MTSIAVCLRMGTELVLWRSTRWSLQTRQSSNCSCKRTQLLLRLEDTRWNSYPACARKFNYYSKCLQNKRQKL